MPLSTDLSIDFFGQIWLGKYYRLEPVENGYRIIFYPCEGRPYAIGYASEIHAAIGAADRHESSLILPHYRVAYLVAGNDVMAGTPIEPEYYDTENEAVVAFRKVIAKFASEGLSVLSASRDGQTYSCEMAGAGQRVKLGVIAYSTPNE
jgi:hypothetical protein